MSLRAEVEASFYTYKKKIWAQTSIVKSVMIRIVADMLILDWVYMKSFQVNIKSAFDIQVILSRGLYLVPEWHQQFNMLGN